MVPGYTIGDSDVGNFFSGTKGKLVTGCYGRNPKLLPYKLMDMIQMPEQTIHRVPEGHYLQWVNACIAGYGNKETSSPFVYAGPFAESILIGYIAIGCSMLEQATVECNDVTFT